MFDSLHMHARTHTFPHPCMHACTHVSNHPHICPFIHLPYIPVCSPNHQPLLRNHILVKGFNT